MRRIVVTGGASGIGAAVAKLLQTENTITILDKQKPSDNSKFIPFDLSDRKSVANAFNQVGEFDVLVHCAGIYIAKQLVDMSDEDISKQISINLTGTTLVNKYALENINKGGVIVNISSALGVVPEPASPVYCASKAGINMLTKALAQQYASTTIRINAVLPGPVDTPLLREAFASENDFKKYKAINPMGRVAQPEEIAKFVEYIISDDAQFITGACLAIDGGESSSSLYSPVKNRDQRATYKDTP